MNIFNKSLIPKIEAYEGQPLVTSPTAQIPHIPQQPITDIQYAANSLCQLCHLDMASLCEYVWGEQPPTSRHDLADRIAAWADQHRSDRTEGGR